MTTDENAENYHPADLKGWLYQGEKILPPESYFNGWLSQEVAQYIAGFPNTAGWKKQEVAAKDADLPALPPGWETKEDLAAKTDYARKIVLEYAPGATTRKPKDKFNQFVDNIKRIQFPKRTLEEKITVKARPKTVPRIVYPDSPGLMPWFIDIPAEENETKEGK